MTLPLQPWAPPSASLSESPSLLHLQAVKNTPSSSAVTLSRMSASRSRASPIPDFGSPNPEPSVGTHVLCTQPGSCPEPGVRSPGQAVGGATGPRLLSLGLYVLFCHFLPVCPKASCFSSLSLSFLICKMGSTACLAHLPCGDKARTSERGSQSCGHSMTGSSPPHWQVCTETAPVQSYSGSV